MLRFRSVDSDDPHPSLPELQRVAVNDAGEAAAATAAAEAGRDAFRLTGEETRRFDQQRIEARPKDRQDCRKDDRPSPAQEPKAALRPELRRSRPPAKSHQPAG